MSVYSVFTLKDFLAPPTFDLHVALKVPKSGLEIEIYLDNKSDLFGESAIDTDGLRTHVFKDLPRDTKMIRIDPAHKANVAFVLEDIRIKTSPEFKLDPSRDVHVVDVSAWKNWHLFDVKPAGPGIGFISTTNDPKIRIPLTVDLAALAIPFEERRDGMVVLMAISGVVAVLSLSAFLLMVYGITADRGAGRPRSITGDERYRGARLRFFATTFAAGILATLAAFHAANVMFHTISARPYLHIHLTLEKIDGTVEPVNRMGRLIVNDDIREIVYPDQGDIEFTIRDIPRVIDSLYIDVPADRNAVIVIRTADFAVDGVNLILGVSNVIQTIDYSDPASGFVIQNLSGDGGPKFTPLSDSATAFRFDFPAPVDLYAEMVRTDWFLSPLNYLVFLGCLLLGITAIVCALSLLFIAGRGLAAPMAVNRYILALFLGGVAVLCASIGPFLRLPSENWVRQREIVQALFSFPREEAFAKRLEYIKRYELLAPEEVSVDIRSKMTAKSVPDIARLRARIIGHMWPDGLPTDRRADAVEAIASSHAHVKKAYAFTLKMDRNLTATTRYLRSVRDGDCLMIFHDGHYIRSNDIVGSAGSQVIVPLLEAGCDILLVPMPLFEKREMTYALNATGGQTLMNGHNSFFTIDDGDRWALRFFLEPAIVSLNEALARNPYGKVGMTGLSGGGWTAVLVAALDTRVRHSYPTLAFLPPPTLPQTKHFTPDFEYRYPPLFEIADH